MVSIDPFMTQLGQTSNMHGTLMSYFPSQGQCYISSFTTQTVRITTAIENSNTFTGGGTQVAISRSAAAP